MPEVQVDFPLRQLNTFGVPALARRFCSIRSREELQAWFGSNPEKVFILGGGSNILLTGNLDRTVLKMDIRHRAVEEHGDKPLVVAGAGENWHDLTAWTLSEGMGGLENLSLIPGTVGAAPIQNIGAYGVEQAEAFERLEAVDRESGRVVVFSKKDCAFGYRDSAFKGKWKDKFAISRVWFRLHRDPKRIHTAYGALKEELSRMGVAEPGVRDVAAAVIRIRRSKLPDPRFLGNAGSFFKNPVIPLGQAEAIQGEFPQMPVYPAGTGLVKVPAGWLIEQCGWKGKRIGDAGCFEKQALVLVNHGSATGAQIRALATRIVKDVEGRFGIRLDTEVNIL